MQGETVLCIAPRRWNSLWRESQQIMSRVARQNRVLYFEPGRDYTRPYLAEVWRNSPNFFRLQAREVSDNLIVLPTPSSLPAVRQHLPPSVLQHTTPLVHAFNSRVLAGYVRRAMTQFGVSEPVLWLNEVYPEFVGQFGEKLSCYHTYDEIADFAPNAAIKTLLLRRDERLTKRVDVVFSSSQAQWRRRRAMNPNAHLVPNGVDFETFHRALEPDLPTPADIASVPRPILGFAGWLSYYIDVCLLRRVAEAYPACSLVLVGPDDLPDNADRKRLRELPNVFFLGRKERSELPGYLRTFDVALMPWVLEGHVLSAYPLKLHEYLAAGRSVVSVPLPELEPFRHVLRIAYTEDDYVRHVGAAIHDPDPAAIAARVAVARENTWDHRVADMYRVIQERLDARQRLRRARQPRRSPNETPPEARMPMQTRTQDRTRLRDTWLPGNGQPPGATAAVPTGERGGRIPPSNPLVSVVIVTWNREVDILEAVQSIYDQEYRTFEVVVVDNASTDGTVHALRRSYPDVRLLVLDHNTGASAGRSAGIAAARGDIVFMLDSDASLAHDTLSRIVQKFAEEPAVGVITCKIVNAFTGEVDAWIFTEKDKADQDVEFPSYSFCSAGAAIRREVVERAGLFWDKLFIYCEEDDLSLRVWDAGYGIIYWPQATIYHRESPQKRVSHSRREYFDLRNSLYIYVVRYPWWMLGVFVPLQIGISLFKGLRGGYVRTVVPALTEVVRELPQLWRERSPISNLTALRYLRLQREHGPLSWDLVSWLRYKT